jgi:imidazolonepropionase
VGGGAGPGSDSGAIAVAALVSLAGPVPRRGPALGSIDVTSDAVVTWERGVITYAGPAGGGDATGAVEAPGSTLVPGFVDCHTHMPFFGWRADEYAARLTGRTYRDQHGEGGIYRSARLLSEASDEEVIAFCRPLAAEMLQHGTTAMELKTGYGLSVEAELRQARLARRLAGEIPQTCTVTLLACHAVPPEMDRREWVRTACEELIPRAAEEGLVDAVDVYVEDIAFSVDDLALVAHAAQEWDLAVRCHADQLGPSRAAEAAVDVGARTGDHLNHVSADGIEALGGAETMATLLPASTLTLRSSPPPVSQLLEAGAAIAVASDFNPGTSPVLSMPEVIALACSLYGLAPLTALAAATVNPAHALGLADRLGALEPGKRADFVLIEGDDFAMVPYRPGHNPVTAVYIAGREVVSRSPGATGPP